MVRVLLRCGGDKRKQSEEWAWSRFHRHMRMGWPDPNLSLSEAKEWPGSSPVDLVAIEEKIGCASQWQRQVRAPALPRCKGWFGRLLPHGLLEFRPSSLKLNQSLFQVGDFSLDLAELCLILAARQAIRAKLLSDVPLKLTPQDPEIWIAPYGSFSVFKFAGSNALHNELPAHSEFILGRYVAEGCPFAVPLAVFRHILSF